MNAAEGRRRWRTAMLDSVALVEARLHDDDNATESILDAHIGDEEQMCFLIEALADMVYAEVRDHHTDPAEWLDRFRSRVLTHEVDDRKGGDDR